MSWRMNEARNKVIYLFIYLFTSYFQNFTILLLYYFLDSLRIYVYSGNWELRDCASRPHGWDSATCIDQSWGPHHFCPQLFQGHPSIKSWGFLLGFGGGFLGMLNPCPSLLISRHQYCSPGCTLAPHLASGHSLVRYLKHSSGEDRMFCGFCLL